MKTIRKRVCLSAQNEYDGSPTYHCIDDDLFLNRHGNWEVSSHALEFLGSKIYFRSAYPYINLSKSKLVFNREFVCISHQPSKRYRNFKVNAYLAEPFV